MKLGKRVMQSGATHFVLPLLVSLLIRAIYGTCRVEQHIPPAAQTYMDGEKPGVFCFWHGRMIMHLFVKPPGRSMSVLSSHHNDGALIAATMRWFDIGTVRGSKKLGGSKALRALLAVTEAGGNISITPDGPRGPFQIAAAGAGYVAAKTGYPLIPVTFSATRFWRFRSWDKFMLPKPFSRILFTVGTPFFVPDSADEAIAAASLQLQTALIDITSKSDQACGVAS